MEQVVWINQIVHYSQVYKQVVKANHYVQMIKKSQMKLLNVKLEHVMIHI